MRRQFISSAFILPAILALASATLSPAPVLGQVVCSGHELLPKPRPDTSCLDVKPAVHPSPDRALRATVLPVDVSLYATPDMESRVVIRTSKGDTLTSKDYSSPRGANGYYVLNAKWAPDSRFFVFSMSSSGGHSPWSFPIMVYGYKRNFFAKFSDMIDESDGIGRFQVHRTAYACRHDMEAVRFARKTRSR